MIFLLLVSVLVAGLKPEPSIFAVNSVDADDPACVI